VVALVAHLAHNQEVAGSIPTRITIKNSKNTMDIHIINNNHSAPIPSLDIYSYVDIPIKPMETVVIDTGIYLDLPSNIEAAIRNIIGYTTTKTLIVEQKIIDSSYKEEVCVIVCNAGEEIQYISEGDKIAQLVFKEVK